MIVAFCVLLTAPVTTGKEKLVAPAGTTTEAGTEATAPSGFAGE